MPSSGAILHHINLGDGWTLDSSPDLPQKRLPARPSILSPAVFHPFGGAWEIPLLENRLLTENTACPTFETARIVEAGLACLVASIKPRGASDNKLIEFRIVIRNIGGVI